MNENVTDAETVDTTDGEKITGVSVNGQKECVYRSYHDKYVPKYDWLKELAHHKAECLPDLDRVLLKEDMIEDHCILADDRPAWLAPRTVVEAFEAAEIDLEVEFMPSPYMFGLVKYLKLMRKLELMQKLA